LLRLTGSPVITRDCRHCLRGTGSTRCGGHGVGPLRRRHNCRCHRHGSLLRDAALACVPRLSTRRSVHWHLGSARRPLSFRGHFSSARLPPSGWNDPSTHCLRMVDISRVRSHRHGSLIWPFRHDASLCCRTCHVVHIRLLSESVRLRWVTGTRRRELRPRSKSERLGAIRVRVHARGRARIRARRSRKAMRHWLAIRCLAGWGGPLVEALWLPVWLALGAEWVREILRLRLALWLLQTLGVPRIIAWIPVGRGAVVGVLRIHWALLARTGSGARIVGCLWASIIAVDGLPHRRRALHHIRCLRGHGGSAVGHPHLRLRGHGLGAASHGGTGAEDVCECRVPCSRGRAILRARELPALLIAVVRHVASSIPVSPRAARASAAELSGRRGRLFGGVCWEVSDSQATHNRRWREGEGSGEHSRTADGRCAAASDWCCAGTWR
jgi:hypothetical protein